MAAKKSKSKKKTSFVLSDEELDKVSGGAGPAQPAVRAIGVRAIAVRGGIGDAGIGAEPYGEPNPRSAPTPMRIRGGAPGGNNM